MASAYHLTALFSDGLGSRFFGLGRAWTFNFLGGSGQASPIFSGRVGSGFAGFQVGSGWALHDDVNLPC